MGESPRRHARELVLQALYASECSDEDPGIKLQRLLEKETISENNALFAREFFAAVHRNSDKADEQITALAANWDINRMAAIDLIVLRMAIVELMEFKSVPVKVVLNESIELVKKYSTAKSSRFINGVLDQFAKNLSSISDEG
ncbi:MAG: transcription antitermination factor NusB [candidate division Zixibacteria bacterium]|nr:transcription antitermination factor NusB [candidate division Zixibacteria bacterium]